MAEHEAKSGTGAATVRLLSCVGVDIELGLLPHFLDHYLGLGVAPDHVHLVLNTADGDTPNFEAADRILDARGIAAGTRWIGPYTSDAMWQQRRRLQEQVAHTGDWIVNADVDELHRYPASLGEVSSYLRDGGFGALQGIMVDRLSRDGTLAAVGADMPLAAQFPVRADVALSIIGIGVSHGIDGTMKLMMHRGDVFPNRGGHTVLGPERRGKYAAGGRLSLFPGGADPDWRAAFPFQVDHYKWTATLRSSLARRLGAEGVSVAGKEYGGKIDRYLARHGQVRLEDASVFAREPHPAPDWQETLRRLRRRAFYWKVRKAVRIRAHRMGQIVRGRART